MRTIVALVVSLFALTASGKNLYIPVAAAAPGGQGTYFRTDLRIYNPSQHHEIDVTLHFLPQGEDGRNISGQVFRIGKHETLVLDNVVESLVPFGWSAVGAIRIDSDRDYSYEFVASSRTYSRSSDPSRPGTFGQFIPALDPADALQRAILLHAVNTPQFRTNAGVMNPGNEPVQIRMILRGADGLDLLVSPVFEVPAKSMRQRSLFELFGGLYLENGVILVEATAPVFSWASAVDNFSGDAIFIPGVEPIEAASPVPMN